MDHMAGDKGFEPLNHGVKVRCLNRLANPQNINNMARPKGFEPLTYGLEGRCSILLSYERRYVVRIKDGAGEGNRTLATGLEGQGSTTELHPPIKMVVGGGFEPPKQLATDLQSAPFGHLGTPPHINGASDGTRTRNLLITSQLLFQLSYTG